MDTKDYLQKQIKSMCKKVHLTVILSLIISFVGLAQKGSDKVVQADSLFDQQKYTESFQLYQDALENDKISSPAMLLKMAFIKDNLPLYLTQ